MLRLSNCSQEGHVEESKREVVTFLPSERLLIFPRGEAEGHTALNPTRLLAHCFTHYRGIAVTTDLQNHSGSLLAESGFDFFFNLPMTQTIKPFSVELK